MLTDFDGGRGYLERGNVVAGSPAVAAGLLRVVGLRGGAVAWELTDAGRRTVDETILPAWWRLAESPDGGASAV